MMIKIMEVLKRDSLKMIGGLGMEFMMKEDCRLYLIIFLLFVI